MAVRSEHEGSILGFAAQSSGRLSETVRRKRKPVIRPGDRFADAMTKPSEGSRVLGSAFACVAVKRRAK